jgi:trigger factor
MRKKQLKKLAVTTALFLGTCAALAACGKKKDTDTDSSTASSADATEDVATPAVVATVDDVLSIGDYKTFSYDAYVSEDTDPVEYYESLVDTYATYGYTVSLEDPDRVGTEVVDGDTINIDYTGYVDGEEFDNGSDTDYDLTIGSDSFIDGFEDALIGKIIGETVDIDVVFPDEYENNPDMAGQAATFTVTINYATKEEELTVDNAYDGLFGFDTYEDCIADIEEYLAEEDESNAESAVTTAEQDYLNYIIDNSEFADLDAAIEYYFYIYYTGEETYYTDQGYDMETIASYYGYEDLATFKDDMYDYAETTVKESIILEAIAAEEGIEFTDDVYQEEAANLIESTGYEVDDYAELYDGYYGDGSFRQYIQDTYILDYLFNTYATVNEAEAEE